MICADFLAGANLGETDSGAFSVSVRRLIEFLCTERIELIQSLKTNCVNAIFPKRTRLKLDPEAYAQLCRQDLRRDGWRCQNRGRGSQLQVHHFVFAARSEMIPRKT